MLVPVSSDQKIGVLEVLEYNARIRDARGFLASVIHAPDVKTERNTRLRTVYLVQSIRAGGRGRSGKSNVASTYD